MKFEQFLTAKYREEHELVDKEAELNFEGGVLSAMFYLAGGGDSFENGEHTLAEWNDWADHGGVD